jgi:hypothetical protein
VRNWRYLVEVMSRTNRISASKYDFPWCFPLGEILKFHFRILTFPSICAAISQSNPMWGLYFCEIWSYSMLNLQNVVLGIRLAWLQRYIWVIQLNLIIHIVEMIRCYLMSTAVLEYDWLEKLEAFGWSDVENESNQCGQVWFSLDDSLQEKFWNFIFAFSHFLACVMISTNRIMRKKVIFRRFGAFQFSLWNGGLRARLGWLQRYAWMIQLYSIIHTVEMLSCYSASTTGLKYDCFEKLEAFGWSDVENEANVSRRVWPF